MRHLDLIILLLEKALRKEQRVETLRADWSTFWQHGQCLQLLLNVSQGSLLQIAQNLEESSSSSQHYETPFLYCVSVAQDNSRTPARLQDAEKRPCVPTTTVRAKPRLRWTPVCNWHTTLRNSVSTREKNLAKVHWKFKVKEIRASPKWRVSVW